MQFIEKIIINASLLTCTAMKKFMRALGAGSSRTHRTPPQNLSRPERSPSSRPSSRHSESGALSELASRGGNYGGANSLPPRAEKKAAALREALENSYVSYELSEYARTALSAASTGSTGEITALDARNKQLLANAYNDRHSELRLSCHDSAQSFFAEFMQSQKPAWRSIVQLSQSSLHHVAMDVRIQDGKRTLLVIEPALARGEDDNGDVQILAGYEQLARNVQNCLGDDGDLAVVQLGAQKSNYDCIIFSLDLALCAYQKDNIFDELHDSLRRNVRCFSSQERKSVVDKNIEFIDGTKFLPAVFFKHAHSRATIAEVIESQPELEGKNVSTGRDNPAETLSERVQDFRVTREKSYSMSIEASRLRKIRKAIE
ncbi:peptidase C55 [Acidovorax sp. SUPP3434]|uniref:YopJ family type III secretion system effector XopJ n=1 Tax=Acidovorax sp. SUPP3434 TaxID=2920880 RepID=UPI0023DE3F13|nr:YopJ family type III secretion system effector XopJ [Acidovorax sp. SUPP3434]GKT01747.1 peptidase C55 [Acidovorax sp. SUPP3434]